MRIGMSSSCLYPELTESAFLRLCNEGVDVCEIFFNASSELEEDFVSLLCGIREEYNIPVVSLHPTMSLAESFMFFSAYDRRYREGMDQYRRYCEIALKLGAKYIVMHGGKPNNVLDNRGYFERFAKISEEVKKCGAVLLQENVNKYRAGNLEVLKEMLEYLGDDVSFCLDVKQSIRGGYSPFDALEALGNKVKHIHISDNTPENDCMLVGKGTFDFKAFFELAEKVGYKGDAIVEVYDNAYTEKSQLFETYKNFKKLF